MIFFLKFDQFKKHLFSAFLSSKNVDIVNLSDRLNLDKKSTECFLYLKLAKYIDRNRILTLEANDVNSALKEMVDASKSQINDSQNFLQALISREELMSTGFGFGIAYPHAKTPDVEEFFITIGVSKQGIDWKSFDGKEARLIFMIGGPDGQQDTYLKLLAGLSSFLKNSQLHDQLCEFCEDLDAFYNFIETKLNQ